MLRNGLKWVGISILSLVLAVVGLWAASRFWPLPAQQREAMRLLQAPVPTNGGNGFSALWTLHYDGLDANAREAVLAQDVKRWRTGTPGQRPVDSSAEGRYAATPLRRCPRWRGVAGGAWAVLRRCAPTRSVSPPRMPVMMRFTSAWPRLPAMGTSSPRSCRSIPTR